jgi:hypothetical protein
MAGSIADFKYTDDNGSSWLVRIDKSNALATGTGFVALTQADLSLNYLPRNIEMRFVSARHPTRPINRKIYCATTTAPIWNGTQKTISLTDYQDKSTQAFNVGKRTSENRKYQPNLIDSYQTDNP